MTCYTVCNQVNFEEIFFHFITWRGWYFLCNAKTTTILIVITFYILFSKILLDTNEAPLIWCFGKIILIHKKSDKTNCFNKCSG